MRIHENLINDREIELLRKYWEKNLDKVYVNGYREEGEIQDYRLDINQTDPEFDIVKSIVKKDFANYLNAYNNPIEGSFYWAALQRAYLPHLLHIDDCFVDDRPAYTYIIAFDSYTKHRTLAWKKICKGGNKELLQEVNFWFSNHIHHGKINNVAGKEDIDHTPNLDNNYMLDYYQFDGSFIYEKGSGCLFNARQMHCTSNWKKYDEFEYRELLQIHITIPDLLIFQ